MHTHTRCCSISEKKGFITLALGGIKIIYVDFFSLEKEWWESGFYWFGQFLKQKV
jgi:hypothetical protein